jgi:hypothetical protein
VSDADQSGAGRREVAYRLFAAEYDDADLSYSESDEERAPNYVVTPTGARVNRLFVVGVLTEVETVGEDVLRARVVDPTGAFVLYAGQYQPDEQAFLDAAETPAFVAVTGKARTFQPDDSDRVYTSVRPESINEVDAETRDRWTVGTAEQTLTRVGEFATALSLGDHGADLESALAERGVDEGLAAGIALALDHYGTSPGYLAAVRELALDAARLVAGEIDEVEPLSVPPDVDGTDLDALDDAPGAGSAVDAGDDAGGSSASTPVTEPGTTATTTAGSGHADSERRPSDGDAGSAAETSSPGETVSTTEPASAAESASNTGSVSTTGEGQTDGPAEPGGADEPADGREDVLAGGEADADRQDVSSDSGEIGDFDPGEFELDDEEREEIEAEYGTEFQSGTEVEEPGEADIETPEPDADQTDGDPADPESVGTTSPDGTADRGDSDPAETTDEPAGAVDAGGPTEATETAEAPKSSDATERVAGTEPTDATEPSDVAGSADPAEPTPASGREDAAGASADDPEPSADDPEPGEGDLEDATVDVMTELDEGDGAAREEVVAAVVERYGVDSAAVEDAIQEALMDGRCYEPDDDTLKPI